MADEAPCPEEAALLEDVAHDGRPAPKLILADWLEDHGREAEAHACRWAASRGLHPRVSPVMGYATWCREGFGPRRHSLPDAVMDAMHTPGQRRLTWYHVRWAFEALAGALAKLKALYELAP